MKKYCGSCGLMLNAIEFKGRSVKCRACVAYHAYSSYKRAYDRIMADRERARAVQSTLEEANRRIAGE